MTFDEMIVRLNEMSRNVGFDLTPYECDDIRDLLRQQQAQLAAADELADSVENGLKLSRESIAALNRYRNAGKEKA